CIQSLDFPLTF
nr:immunoglobulin light chain junction region [Macaca mulatta]